MKKYFFYFLLLLTSVTYSQKIRGFGGFGVYLNRNFDNSGFASFNTGLEYKVNTFISPEIEFEYFIGALPDNTKEDESGVETELLVRTVVSTNFSISPKIILGDEEDFIHFQIIPIYNITNVVAKGSLYTLNDKKNDLIKSDTDEYRETRHSLGIGIGALFDLNEDSSQSLAFNVYYNNINMGNALTNLKFNKGIYSTNQSLGIGIKYYFCFSKKKIKNEKEINAYYFAIQLICLCSASY